MITDKIEEMEQRLEEITDRIDEIEAEEEEGITDPDLIRRLVLTVTNFDRLTEEEGDRLLGMLID